ncbi:MAG: hypothetical protein AB9921_02475 [Erysipelotrichaceae bacterium]
MVNTSSKRLVEHYAKFSRYEYVCSDYWRVSYASAWSPYKLTTTAQKTALCQVNTTKDYYRWDGKTETTGWSGEPYKSGYSQSATGYTYQTKDAPVKVYGAPYWETSVDTGQNILGTRRVEIIETITSNLITINYNNTTIGTSNMLSEADVNARVAQYTYGAADSLIFDKGNKGSMAETTYDGLVDANYSTASQTAINKFKEGSYWGLYLYQTGHWRAVEVPVQWFSITGITSANLTLTATGEKPVVPVEPPVVAPVDPPKKPETGASLTDLQYVQGVFNRIVSENPKKSNEVVQGLFITAIKQDANKGAAKVLAYYDALVLAGKSPNDSLRVISKDFNLKLYK